MTRKSSALLAGILRVESGGPDPRHDPPTCSQHGLVAEQSQVPLGDQEKPWESWRSFKWFLTYLMIRQCCVSLLDLVMQPLLGIQRLFHGPYLIVDQIIKLGLQWAGLHENIAERIPTINTFPNHYFPNRSYNIIYYDRSATASVNAVATYSCHPLPPRSADFFMKAA